MNQIIKYATGIFILPGIVIVIAPANSIVTRGESVAGPGIFIVFLIVSGIVSRGKSIAGLLLHLPVVL